MSTRSIPPLRRGTLSLLALASVGLAPALPAAEPARPDPSTAVGALLVAGVGWTLRRRMRRA